VKQFPSNSTPTNQISIASTTPNKKKPGSNIQLNHNHIYQIIMLKISSKSQREAQKETDL
jgi:hypothetical protein